MSKVKIWYDNTPNEVVDKISSEIDSFGITIEQLEGGDGFEEYEITRNNDAELLALIRFLDMPGEDAEGLLAEWKRKK